MRGEYQLRPAMKPRVFPLPCTAIAGTFTLALQRLKLRG
jgi:hypothetical protein